MHFTFYKASKQSLGALLIQKNETFGALALRAIQGFPVLICCHNF